MKKDFIKSIFKIEYLLFFVSFICFTTVFHFKNITERKFMSLDLELSSSIINFDSKNQNKNLDNFFSKFENDFESICLFNDNIKNSLPKLRNTETFDTEYKKEFIDFQNSLKQIQKTLMLGFNNLSVCSILLFTVSIFVMIVKTISKNSELENIKSMSENQKIISRELHDTVAQNIATLKIHIKNKDTEKAEYYSTQALNDIRYFIGSMHIDFSEDFESVLKEMLKTFELNYKIETKFFTASDFIQKLDSKTQIEIYRIFQEVLTNTARHSKATVLTVRIMDLSNKLRIIFSDNGIGIKDSDFEKENHYGLKSIVERVKILNGTVDFTNAAEGGLTIAITIKHSVR